MIDYKKAEQAKKLLKESGVDYVLGYVDEDNVAKGNVEGTVLMIAYCAIAIMRTIGEPIRDKHGDKAVVETLHNITMEALQQIYSDSKKE